MQVYHQYGVGSRPSL